MTDIPQHLFGLKALTMTAPYGTAIMRWKKPWENRSWPAPKALWNTRIGIHQSALSYRGDGSMSDDDASLGVRSSFDSIVQAGLLIGLDDASGHPLTKAAAIEQYQRDSGYLIGTVRLSDIVSTYSDHAVSLWANPGVKMPLDPWMQPGGYAFHFIDHEHLPEPIRLSGLQKFWTVDERRHPKPRPLPQRPRALLEQLPDQGTSPMILRGTALRTINGLVEDGLAVAAGDNAYFRTPAGLARITRPR